MMNNNLLGSTKIFLNESSSINVENTNNKLNALSIDIFINVNIFYNRLTNSAAFCALQ